ncbi:hydrolase 2, exosortase A system-associated [Endozoicomonas sp. SM1973]|uniref:Hydrolase 2, exosortase A system-associated n=1 Tax=Spartinivicinus marinus TaxID=2994442 RepID=A0A853IC62_9GAMM|nr:hydrolase 2, exosortase A system-associated [Spartinivicinus marinus]MCX4024972.1 hydrolase 2, exosortase A system-associated [Spartinivicinus marinus]NYZ67664.1 hydrolase 2, exosortase A system-associated [Spartinivicinus marinus]
MDRLQISPHFLSTPAGHLYAVHYVPPSAISTKGYIVHIPAFAEEMNKSRHIISKQARLMAEQGWQVVVFDLSGTGDSEGLLVDVDWPTWLNNIQAVMDWLMTEPLPVVLWGLRLGACLAVDYLNRLPSPENTHLLLWQPIIKGQPFLQQFLRMRLAADLLDKQTGETVKLLREQLVKEGSLEVAGYLLPNQLTSAIDQIDLTQQLLPLTAQVVWLEMIRETGASLSLPSQKTIAAWQQNHNKLHQTNIVTDPFWSTQELTTGDGFIEQTLHYLPQLLIKSALKQSVVSMES